MSHQHDVTLKLGQAASHNPGKFKLYRRYADDIWTSTEIDARTTEIIAVGSTHITRCSYCVDFHASRAKTLGVSGAELIEVGVIAAALRALEITTLGAGASGFPEHASDPFLDLPSTPTSPRSTSPRRRSPCWPPPTNCAAHRW